MLKQTTQTVLGSLCMVAGVIGSVFIFSAMGPQASASVAPVAPTPVVEAVPSYDLEIGPIVVQTAEPVKLVKKHATALSRVWTCGNWGPLDNDSTQQVKRCEWK